MRPSAALNQGYQSSRTQQQSPGPLFKALLARQSTWTPPSMPDILKQDDVEGRTANQRSAVTSAQLWGSEQMPNAATELQPESFPPLHLPTMGQTSALAAAPSWTSRALQQQQQQLASIPEAPKLPPQPMSVAPLQNTDVIDDPAMTTDGMEPAVTQSAMGSSTQFAAHAQSPLPVQRQPPVAQPEEFFKARAQPLSSWPAERPQPTAQETLMNSQSQQDKLVVSPTEAAAVLWGAFTPRPAISDPQGKLSNPHLEASTAQSAMSSSQPVQPHSVLPNPQPMVLSPQPIQLNSGPLQHVKEAPSQHLTRDQVQADIDPVMVSDGFAAGGRTSVAGLDCSQPDPPPPCPWIAPGLHS